MGHFPVGGRGGSGPFWGGGVGQVQPRIILLFLGPFGGGVGSGAAGGDS